jgi:hypothetical protein
MTEQYQRFETQWQPAKELDREIDASFGQVGTTKTSASGRNTTKHNTIRNRQRTTMASRQRTTMAKQKRKNSKLEKESLNSWASSLAKECSEVTANTTGNTTKQERIEKRAVKKRRREERKVPRPERDVTPVSLSSNSRENVRRSRKNESLLASLGDEMKESVDAYLEVHGSSKCRPYSVAGLARARNKKKNWDEDNIQPRGRDYGGIGLARSSLFLELSDPSLTPKIEVEFAEHIPGFFGKQRTKAMKKQQAGKMLWRQIADKKNAGKKVNGKKLSDMKPDEKVEAMIQAGMI